MDKMAVLEDLKGEVCKCGNSKKSMRSFCGKCYYSLPSDLRDRLYLRFEQGYKGAFEEALEHLVDMGRVSI